MVGIPGTGQIAFDVKAKSLYNNDFIFELLEVARMRNFARLFHLTVYFACLDPEGGPASYWIRLNQFDNLMPVRQGSALVLKIPADTALPVSLREPFQEAFQAAIRLV